MPEIIPAQEAKVVIVNLSASVFEALATKSEKLKHTPNARIIESVEKSLNGIPIQAMMYTAKATPKTGGKTTRQVLKPK